MLRGADGGEEGARGVVHSVCSVHVVGWEPPGPGDRGYDQTAHILVELRRIVCSRLIFSLLSLFVL